MKKAEVAEMERIQAEVRRKLNPKWREQLEYHKEILKELGPGTPVEGLLRMKRGNRQRPT